MTMEKSYIHEGHLKSGKIFSMPTADEVVKRLENEGGGKYWNTLHKFGFEVKVKM
jgi:hypothetical protein